MKCPRSSLSKYSKISVNGFQVGSVAEVIRKSTNNVDRAKIVLRDKNCITDSCVLVMSNRQLFGEYEIQVKRSSKVNRLTLAGTVSITEEKPDLSNYVNTAAVLNVLDKTIALLDSVRQRIKSK